MINTDAALKVTMARVVVRATVTALLFTIGRIIIGVYIGKSGIASALAPLRR